MVPGHLGWIEKGGTGLVPARKVQMRVRRASPKMLAFFEGVFRALAETTEDELDSGAWSKTVETQKATETSYGVT